MNNKFDLDEAMIFIANSESLEAWRADYGRVDSLHHQLNSE